MDNDVVHQLFGDRPTEAGGYFRQWLSRANGGVIVAGGRLLRELSQNAAFARFFGERLLAGRAVRIRDKLLAAEEANLRSAGLRSNDAHVIALARVSGARLLFTNDEALKDDFANSAIVPGTKGRIYTTDRGRRVSHYAQQQATRVTRTHQDLLRRTDLCEG